MKKHVIIWKNEILIGFATLIAYILLRSINLTSLPVFGDEAIYIRWAQVMRAEPTLRFLPLSDGKQPLFMWSVIPFLKIFSNPLVAGRVVSVITGLITTVGVFVLTVLLFGLKGKNVRSLNTDYKSFSYFLKQIVKDKLSIKVALVASLLYTFSPFTLFFDRMALVDSMLTMFGVWTLIFSLIAINLLRFDFALLAGFSLGGALLTKSPGVFFLLLLPSVWFFSVWPKSERSKARDWIIRFVRYLFLFATTSTIAVAMYNILRLGPNFHLLSMRTKDYVYPVSHIFQNPLDPLLPFLGNVNEYFWTLAPSLVLVFFVLALLFNFKSHKKSYLLLLLWGLTPIIIVSEFSKTMTARYILFSIPYIYIVSASVFLIKNKLFLKVLVFGLVMFLFQSIQINSLIINDIESAPLPQSERSGYLEEWTAGTGIYEASQIIRQEYYAAPDEKIVVGTEGYFGTLPDGLQAYLSELPEITVIGVGSNMTKLPESLIESKKAGNKTYLVINDSRIIAEPTDLGLLLIAAFPKAFRTEGTMEYINKGPRETLYLFEVTNESISLSEETSTL